MKLLRKYTWSYSLFKDQKTDFEVEKIIFTKDGYTLETTNSSLKIEELEVSKKQLVGKNLVVEADYIEVVEKVIEHQERTEIRKMHTIAITDANGQKLNFKIETTYFKKTEFGKKVSDFAEKYNISYFSALEIIKDLKL